MPFRKKEDPAELQVYVSLMTKNQGNLRAFIISLMPGSPDVADVLVRGVRDAEWGQRIEALVVPAKGAVPTLKTLRDHVKSAHPPFMAPTRLMLVDQIPRTALGKPIRR